MIMPQGQPLLLPARPLFIWASLLVALLLNVVPLGRAPWRPDVLALVLVFWSVHQPQRVGVGIAFLFGLAMDVHQAALLGQHALAYTVLGFGAISMHRRLTWFSTLGQAVQVLPLLVLAQAIALAMRMLMGAPWPGMSVLLAPLIAAMLWPLVSLALLAPQRRAPNPDENRPL